MLEAHFVNFSNFFPLDVSSKSEVLETPFQSQNNGFCQAGIGHLGWEADVFIFTLPGNLISPIQ